MSLRALGAALAGLVVGGAVVFAVLQRHVVGAPGTLAVPAEVTAAVESHLEDLKRLASADPARAAEYRTRFESLGVLARRLHVLELNRQAMERRRRLMLLVVVVVTLLLAGAGVAWRHGRDTARLQRLEQALRELAMGRPDIDAGVGGVDAIGAVARTVERLSRAVARDRQRLASLQNLAAWQEAARRQAHELRAPLTAAGLELDNVEKALGTGDADTGRGATGAVRQELQRLRIFAQQFASFARLPQPSLAPVRLEDVAREFRTTFAAAWPGVRLEVVPPPAACPARLDRAMIRQVLQNLCDNSARAMGVQGGTITFTPRPAAGGWVTMEVADDGPGIPAEVRSRLFQPYVTTAPPGHGMGLGLAISRKILLDHGGDLELLPAVSGTVMSLRLPSGGES